MNATLARLGLTPDQVRAMTAQAAPVEAPPAPPAPSRAARLSHTAKPPRTAAEARAWAEWLRARRRNPGYPAHGRLAAIAWLDDAASRLERRERLVGYAAAAALFGTSGNRVNNWICQARAAVGGAR